MNNPEARFSGQDHYALVRANNPSADAWWALRLRNNPEAYFWQRPSHNPVCCDWVHTAWKNNPGMRWRCGSPA